MTKLEYSEKESLRFGYRIGRGRFIEDGDTDLAA